MKQKYFFYFQLQTINEPVTYILIKDYNIKVNILKAQISPEHGGELLVELEADKEQIDLALTHLQGIGLVVEKAETKISYDQQKCIHCGACSAVCCTDALKLNRTTWQLEYNPRECIACGSCIDACPLRLFSLNEP